MEVPWIILAIFVLVVILGIIALIFTKKRRGHKTDYYALFIMGITWIPIGIIFMATDNSLGTLFLILGLAYMAIGLTHKKKWKKNHVCFDKLSDKKKKARIILILVVGLLVLMGLITFYLVKRGII
jgi:4-amino-4-deoxy-L-arabinose transferase-like glycosyltransferase